MSNVYEKLIKRVTDNYNRNENSNIAKMMKLAAHHVQENEDLLDQIGRWRDIDQAEGVTLDYLGRNVGQDREGFDDEVFRVLIKARIIKNNSNGSIPTVIRFIAFILGVDKRFIKVVPKWTMGEPVGIYIEIDLAYAEALGLPLLDFCEIVNDLLGPGIPADIYFKGTFMFADGDVVQEDEDHGFGEVVTDTYYHTGTFVAGDIGEKDTEAEILIDDALYVQGDYYTSGTGTQNGFAGQTKIKTTVHGWAADEMLIGGKFGAYYKINTFKDGTSDIIKAW